MIKNKHIEVTPFGGIHLVHKALKSTGVFHLIKDELGGRSNRATYSYLDLLLSRCYTVLCGGTCTEDVNYIRDTLEKLKGLKVPSADRILDMEEELSTPIEEYRSQKGVLNQINVNDHLNGLLIKVARHLKILNSEQKDYCLDFDNQFLPCEKYDAVYGYKKQRGYFPGVATINNTPVYIENRNGNSHVGFGQSQTLERVFNLLDENQITVKHARMDSGSYQKDITNFLNDKCSFYIRADRSDSLLLEAAAAGEWKQCRIGFKDYEVCKLDYKFGDHKHKMICYRCTDKNKQLSLITGDTKRYMFILTNNTEWSEKQIIEFYNQRGGSERVFDIQNNDFNWKHMPSSKLQVNTVYLIIMAICNVLYQWLIKFFSKMVKGLEPHNRIKRFRFRVICFAAKLTRSARQNVLTIFAGNKLDLTKFPP